MNDFPRLEFERRLTKAQSLMDQQGLDALLITNQVDFVYFTGFRTPFWQSPTRPWYLVIPKTGSLIACIPSIGEAYLGRTWVEDIRTWSSPHPTDDGLGLLYEALKPFKQLGLAMGRETALRMPLSELCALQDLRREAGLPKNFHDATPIIQGCRRIKSALEVDKIRQACRVGSQAFDEIPKLIHMGMSQKDAFRAFKIECLRQGADDVPFLVGASVEGGYSDIIAPPTDDLLASGDLFMLDLGLTFDGYFCDFNRNFALGWHTKPVEQAYALLFEATEAGLAGAKIGRTCADLFQEMNAIISQDKGPKELGSQGAGSEDEAGGVGRLGHGLGMDLTEFPSLIGHDQTVLEAGMVLTLEPSLSYGDGKMMVTEENILISEDGPELLTKRAPAVLPLIHAHQFE